jgi:hypothetical protein
MTGLAGELESGGDCVVGMAGEKSAQPGMAVPPEDAGY